MWGSVPTLLGKGHSAKTRGGTIHDQLSEVSAIIVGPNMFVNMKRGNR
jgi:hypothetical protein